MIEFSNRPELLAPAGTFETLRAALTAGADSVYFGCDRFNARGEQASFRSEDLPQIMLSVRRAGAKGYLALNTLIYQRELNDALELAVRAYAAGVDGIIIQDIGLARLLNRFFPELRLLASTQMSVGTSPALRAVRELGVSRVILPRELSLSEIACLTKEAHELGIQTEVFVQGALCVSFSGQCSLSRLRGGRSANRGECAGPCRLNWRLIQDGRGLGDFAALLSPKDLNALAVIDQLVATGVDSLKIEGRLRSPLYVATAVEQYRKALDGEPLDEDAMLLAYNRGGDYTDANLRGLDGRQFLSEDQPGNQGLRIGVVVNTIPRKGWLEFRNEKTGPLSVPGDGDVLAIRATGSGEEVASSPVTQISRTAGIISCRGFHPDILATLRRGDAVHRMTNKEKTAKITTRSLPRIPIVFELSEQTSQTGFQFVLTARTADLKLQTAPMTAISTAPAENRPPLSDERVARQLGKTGSTPFSLKQFENNSERPLTLAVSTLNRMRREVLDQLERRLSVPHEVEARDLETRLTELTKIRSDLSPSAEDTNQPDREHSGRLSTRAYYPMWTHLDPIPTPESADIISLPADELDFLMTRDLSVIHDWKQQNPDRRLSAVLPPCMDLAQFDGLPSRLSNAGIDEALTAQPARKNDPCFQTLPALAGDFGLNLMNQQAVAQAADWGLTGLSLSPELSEDETERLLDELDKVIDTRRTKVELLAYGRQRAMYMKHCPVGFRVQDCARCADGNFSLKDGKNREYPLICHPNGGCRVELLAADKDERGPLRSTIDPNALIARFVFTDETVAEQQRIMDRWLSDFNDQDAKGG